MAFNTLKNHARILRDFLIDLVYPRKCAGCGREGVWLCGACRSKTRYKSAQHCPVCFKTKPMGMICRGCNSLDPLQGVLIAGSYEDESLSRLIKWYKYGLAAEISAILGRFLVEFLSYQAAASPNTSLKFFKDRQSLLLVPVPLHQRRLRWRGFNQAALLAEMIRDNFHIRTDDKHLERTRFIRPQTKLNPAQRAANVHNSFIWTGPDLEGQNIILLDDVITTGSTLRECAKALKQAGAGQIYALCLARN